MRHDAKLGLALGMLVLGFAVAFCFPRQPESPPWMKLDKPGALEDPELDFLPIRAYQPPRPERVTPAEYPAAPDVGSASTQPIEIGSEPPPPPPIAPLHLETPLAEILAPPAENRSETPNQGPLKTVSAPVPAAPQKTYRVRAGDTLSGIASRLLGNATRYNEIFEANRDRLATPDDLRIGLELRIPSKTQSTAPGDPPVTTESPTMTADRSTNRN